MTTHHSLKCLLLVVNKLVQVMMAVNKALKRHARSGDNNPFLPLSHAMPLFNGDTW